MGRFRITGDLDQRPGMEMPPCSLVDGKVVVFFPSPQKFKAPCATIGLRADANPDEEYFWPGSFAVAHLEADDDKKNTELLRRVVD